MFVGCWAHKFFGALGLYNLWGSGFIKSWYAHKKSSQWFQVFFSIGCLISAVWLHVFLKDFQVFLAKNH